MSPKQTILRHLYQVHEDDPAGFTTPTTIQGFDPGDPKHTQAMNTLFRDRLINGVKAPDGGMAIALNAGNLPAARKAMRSWYASPKFLTLLIIAGGIGTAGLLIG